MVPRLWLDAYAHRASKTMGGEGEDLRQPQVHRSQLSDTGKWRVRATNLKSKRYNLLRFELPK